MRQCLSELKAIDKLYKEKERQRIFEIKEEIFSDSYSHGSSKVIVIRADAVISAKNLKMEPNDGSTFNVVVKDKSGKVLKDIYVKSIIDGKSYLYKTDSSGVAKLKITNGAGYKFPSV